MNITNIFIQYIDVEQRNKVKIYCCGNENLLYSCGIGFCGSRKVSAKGLTVAVDCASQCARDGFNVVSGYASGVDINVHRAALASGGTTTIVLPIGIDLFRIKSELIDVWDWNRVLVVSQFEPDARWKVYRAMARNHIIIALSKAMIVIEAGIKGGTMAAGLTTLKKNKPLYVIEYSNNDNALGNKELLRKGGIPIYKSMIEKCADLRKLFYSLKKVKYVQNKLPFVET